MICTECNSKMYHSDGWDEYWDGEEEQTYYWARWDCLDCGHDVQLCEDVYESPEKQ